jgi:hypothetical protein
MVIITTLLLRPLQNVMHERMVRLRDSLLQEAELLLGRDIEYGSMGPSLFGTLDIRNVRIAGADGASQPLLEVSRLRLSYSLLRLVRGMDGVIQGVQLDTPAIHFDVKRDAAIISLFSSLSSPADGDNTFTLASLFEDGMRLWLHNGTAALSSGENHVALEGLTIDAALRKSRITFQGRWNANASVNVNLGEESAFALRMENHVSGESTADFSTISANLRIGALSSTAARFIAPLSISVTLEKDVLRLVKVNDSASFDLSATYNLVSDSLNGVFLCKNYMPAALISLIGPLKSYNELLDTKISGTAAFTYDETTSLSYDLALSGTLPPNIALARMHPDLAAVDALKSGSLSFTLDGSGDANEITFDALSLTIAHTRAKPALEGTVSFQGRFSYQDFAAAGTVALSNVSVSGGERFNTDLDVVFQDHAVTLQGPALYFGAARFDDFDVTLAFAEKGLSGTLSMLRPDAADAPNSVHKSLAVEAFLDYEPMNLELNAVIEQLSPQDALNLLAPFVTLPELPVIPFVLEELLVDGNLFVTTDFTKISYSVSQCGVSYSDAGQLFFGALSGTDTRLTVYDGNVTLGGETLIGTASVDFASLDAISFSAAASIQNTPYQLSGTILDRNAISVQGAYGLALAVNMPEGAYSGYVSLTDFPVLVQGQFARVSLAASARYHDDTVWSVDLDRLEVTNLATPISKNNSLHIVGKADQDGAYFPDLFFNDGLGALAGTLDLRWNEDFSFVTGDVAIANDAATTVQPERYDLIGVLADNRLSVRFEGADMKLERFFQNAYGAVASGNAQLQWTSAVSSITRRLPASGDVLSMSVALTSLSATISGNDVALSASAFLDADQIEVRDIQGHYGNLHVELPLLLARRPESHVDGTIRIQNPDDELDITSSLVIDFKPISSWFRLDDAASSFNGSLSFDIVHSNLFEVAEPFSFVFSRKGGFTVLQGGPRNMIRLRLSDEGDFYAALSAPAPVRGSVTGSLKGTRIDATASDLYVDLAGLWKWIPPDVKEVINLSGGFVTGTVRIVGPVADPEFFGSMQGNNVRMQVPAYLTHEIRPVPLVVTIARNEMRFGPIPAGVGSGQGLVAGWFRFDRWVPSTFNLDIKVPSETPLPIEFDIIGIMAKGYAAGNLTLFMENSVLTVTGDLTAQNTDITLNAEKLAENERNPYVYKGGIAVITDFTIRSGKKLSFIWPSEDFPILRAYTDIGSTLNISSDDAGGHFSLSGDINMRSGEIFYFQRNFYIHEGKLSFNENEVQFDPRISARAELRDQTDQGVVTISMIIDNAPLQSFIARCESNPPLSQAEIFAHLGQNIVGTNADESTSGLASLGSAIGDIFAQTWGVRRVERFIREFIFFDFLDMMSFRTQMVQNLLIAFIPNDTNQKSSTGTDLDSTTDEARRIGFSNFVDNTTVFLGKYFDPNIFFQAMFSLRYDWNRTAQAQGRPTIYGYAFEADVGIELQSPWGIDFRMGIVPIHYEHLFVDDIAFSINFRRSFYGLKDFFSR